MEIFLYIEFYSDRLRELFEDLDSVSNSRNLMKRAIGVDLTKGIARRYEQIKAFSSFQALQQSGFGKIESLSGDLEKSYSMRISANYRLILRPCTDDLNPESLKKCDTLVIEGVMDYHGEHKKNDWIIP